jgi:hypothetical protein
MAYRVLADLVVVIHLLFIVFVVLGGLLVLRWRWLAAVHVPAALWGALIELAGGICPLTPIENALRDAAGASGYTGGFVEHYLLPVVYPPALSRAVQLALAAVVVAVNATVYGRLWSTARARRSTRERRGG